MGDFWVTSKADGEALSKQRLEAGRMVHLLTLTGTDFKYADKTDIDNAVKEYDTSLGQDEVFNKLTNGGEDQGIYIQDKKLVYQCKLHPCRRFGRQIYQCERN
mgnify:CR=1 FL=1